ncbi:MAG: hypothetical protein WCY58_00475 [Mariniphaga sp.]|nr:hypothetical protein [Mariniphaga sp.]MDD4424327.1 hypothetical protein [Mariniphaga sp.]
MNSKSIFSGFPAPDELMDRNKGQNEQLLPDLNGHIHTPHSFSAFPNIETAFQMAREEQIVVLGINDFYTTDGYGEFAELAEEYRIFPLFNIEFMALQHDLQKAGIRVNDPNNPGRTYFSGKGLRYPVSMSASSQQLIAELQQESNRQTYQMVEKLNAFFRENHIDIYFDPAGLHRSMAKSLFRERHIAQAIRQVIFEKEPHVAGRLKLFESVFGGNELKSSLENVAQIENEIRGNLLKAGGAAFVPEDPRAFLSLDKVMDIIIDAGGIPCYPVLLDDSKGILTEYEADWEKLLQELVQKNVFAIELIPGRNDFNILKDFVGFFHKHGFLITFGTEHNSPQLDPLKITCRHGVPLDNELKAINYEGAAVIAAHQYLVARGEEGYLKGRQAQIKNKEKFVTLGKEVIAHFMNK